MKNIWQAIAATFSDRIYIVLAVSFAANMAALDYILLSQSTTFRIMSLQNTALFNGAALGMSVLIAILFGISAAMLIYVFRQRHNNAVESAPSTFLGTAFAAVASGCPVCGVWLLPLLGIAGSLAVFPFQGLEIKALAILLLLFSISRSANVVLGICTRENRKKRWMVNFTVVAVSIAALFLLPFIPPQYKVKFQLNGVSAPTLEQIAFEKNMEGLAEQVNPQAGFVLNANYGNMGYKLVENGVIDFELFSEIYRRSGQPLSEDQLKVFSKEGLNEPIVINAENAYFLLNLFWAFGLANENPILTEGQITQYGAGRIGDFASTGGWTIAAKPLEEIYAKLSLAPLNEAQQARLQKVAENTYRPCCGNSTAFPDCNHGMALLGVLALLAASDASEDELFEAAKYFSAYWFPSQAYDVATFFMATEGTEFADIDPALFVSEQLFSGRGWSQVRGWLDQNLGDAGQNGGQGGGGCGV